jgi:hypothetical protein
MELSDVCLGRHYGLGLAVKACDDNSYWNVLIFCRSIIQINTLVEAVGFAGFYQDEN